MDSSIQIVEKPDWVSWDDIHEVIWAAHEKNREKGVLMRFPSLSGDEIRQRIEGKGVLFCAIDNKKVVATSAVVKKSTKMWFDKGPSDYAYFCFAAVLPEYAGRGLYKQFYAMRESACREMGLGRIMFDTHEKNKRVFEINKKNGFLPVDYRLYNDHFNIVFVKWLDGCPYSTCKCNLMFFLRKLRVKGRHWLKCIKKSIIR